MPHPNRGSPLHARGLCVVVVDAHVPSRQFALCPLDELGQVFAEARVKGIRVSVLNEKGEEWLFHPDSRDSVGWCGAGQPPAWLDQCRAVPPGEA